MRSPQPEEHVVGSSIAGAARTKPALAAGLTGRAGAAGGAELAEQVIEGLESSGADPRSPTFVMLFASGHHVHRAAEVGEELRRRLSPGCLVGVTGEAVIGGAIEHEGAQGAAVLAGQLPGTSVHAFCSEDLPLMYGGVDGLGPVGGGAGEAPDEDELRRLAIATGLVGEHRATFLFADPFSTRLTTLLPDLTRARRLEMAGAGKNPIGGAEAGRDGGAGPIMGGIASAATRPRGNALILNDRVMDAGLVGISLSGRVRVDPVVSQGCLAFGPNMVVTAAQGNTIRSLGGKTALQALNEAIESLPADQRQLLSRGVFVGRVVNEYKTRFGRDDYLIRGVTGVSKEGGELAINDIARVGQTMRFHLRDAKSADADLGMLLDGQRLHGPPLGVVLVTCNGRGRRMFETPNHDAAALAGLFAPEEPGEARAKGGEALAPAGLASRPGTPLAGFFAAGEIGPVGGESFVHGFTACAAVFRA